MTSFEMSLFMRRKILDISYSCGHSTHIGGALSMVDIMAVLYNDILKYDPKNTVWEERDRFILSKGHGVLGFFPALLASGIISEDTFQTFMQDGSDLISHPVMNLSLGIESSNGSLGHGISMATGIAAAAVRKEKEFRTYCLLGDGELNEGSVWEAAMLAAHLELDKLTIIIDHNKMQNDGSSEDVLQLNKLPERFESFGWNCIEIDGHNLQQISEAFEKSFNNSKPKAIIANTVKGKGVSFMENDNSWHHNRLTKSSYEKALESLNNEYSNGN